MPAAMLREKSMEVREMKIGVVGCGTMGSGIAAVFAKGGFMTTVNEITSDALFAAKSRLEKKIGRESEKGKISAEESEMILRRLKWKADISELEDCGLVIEAIIEDKKEKIELFQKLERVCNDQCVFASNTSSYSITELACAVQRTERVIGMHFFYPVEMMKLIEIVRSEVSSDKAISIAEEVADTLGKSHIVVKDTPGFVVNRLLIPYFLDSIRVLEEGLSSAEVIDRGMTEGGGFVIGPFRLLDHVGLDTIYYIAKSFYNEFYDKRFAPPPLLKRMVLAGKLGRKSGEGFYRYT